MAFYGYKAVVALAGLLGAALLWPGAAAAEEYVYPQLPSAAQFVATLLASVQPEAPAKVKNNAPADKEADNKDKDNGKDKDKSEDKPAWYSVHGQTTVVSQGSWPFRSPYQGPLSFLPKQNYRTTMTGTLFLGAKLWDGGEVYFNPEIAGGTGLSSTFGMG